MFQLYIGNKESSSWSLRPWVLLSELEIPFEEHLVPFDDGGSWQKYRAFSPTGQVPCLHDGPTVVWESLAITEYLAEAYPEIWPSDPAIRAWGRAVCAEMHSSFRVLREQRPMSVGQRWRAFSTSTPLRADLDRIAELWQQGLNRYGGPFLAGDRFTAVDAFFCPVAFRIQAWALSMTPEALAYADRLLALASMQKWAAAALIEPYREPVHEQAFAALGELIEDHRQPHS